MSDHISPIVWSKPVGLAANKDAGRIDRIKAYRATHTTILANGVRPTPKIQTVLNILQGFDLLGARLIVSQGDF